MVGKTLLNYNLILWFLINQWGRRGMHIGDWWESQKERDHYEDQDIGGWTILK
jgi:hypothetical protein